MIRLNVPEGDNRCTPYPGTCRTCDTLGEQRRRDEGEERGRPVNEDVPALPLDLVWRWACQRGIRRAYGVRETQNRPFFEGDDFDAGLVSSVLEGETIFTAEEVRDGRRNKAI